MKKISIFLGVMTALVTLTTGLITLSELTHSPTPPPLVVNLKDIYNNPSAVFSERYISGSEVEIPDGFWKQIAYSFHRATKEAWKMWLRISIGVSLFILTLAGLGVIYEGADYYNSAFYKETPKKGFWRYIIEDELYIDGWTDAVEIIGFCILIVVGTISLLISLKAVWLAIRVILKSIFA